MNLLEADIRSLAGRHDACTLHRAMCDFRLPFAICCCLMLLFAQLTGAHMHLVHDSHDHGSVLEGAAAHSHEHASAHVAVSMDEHHEFGQNVSGHADIDAPEASGGKLPHLLLALVAAMLFSMLWSGTRSLSPRPNHLLIPWQPRLLIPPAQAPPLAS